MKEEKECPNCKRTVLMEVVGSMGTTQKKYICPVCQYQFTE